VKRFNVTGIVWNAQDFLPAESTSFRYIMLSPRRIGCSRCAIVACAIGMLLASRALAAPLLDFKDNAQLAQIRVSGQTKIELASESYQGKRAAKIVFAPVPEGLRDYPAVVFDGTALKIRDFSSFEAISLWVKNPGPDDAELSLAIWDKDGNRAFPIPSTFTIKPGRWEQVVARLVLHGLDAKQIGSVHFYQKANRRPITLLIADVQLLSPSAGRLTTQVQATRQALNVFRGKAAAIGAKDQVEPKIAALARGLDNLESTAATASTASQKTERLLELARIAAEAQELVNSIQFINGGRRIVLSGPLVEASWLSNLDQVKTFAVFVLSDTSLGDEVFQFLAPAKNLEAVILDSRKITGKGMAQLTTDKLRRLVLSATGVNDDALKEIGSFPKLQELELDGTNVTSGVFPYFESLKQLKNLSLAGTQVTDAGFEAVGKLTSLESLNLNRTKIRGQGLRHLASLKKLKSLDLGDTKLDDGDLSAFGKLTQLESLSLENTPITGAGFGQLKGLGQLTALNLNKTRVGDSALRQLGKLPRLQRLQLSSTRVADGGLTHILASSGQLNYLDLFGTNITDAGLASLQNKQGLQALFLGGTQTSDLGLSYFKKLNNLQILDLEGTQITDAGLQHLKGMKLVSLKLGKTRIAGSGLKHLAGLTELRVLDLSGTSVTDDSLADLAPLKKLQTLLLSGTRVTSKGMRQLQGAPQLVDLQLEATDVGDPGIELLTALPNLQRLNLNETTLTNDGLKHLKKLGKLTTLSLSRTRITDQGLLELGEKYVDLDLSHTRITNQGVEQIQRSSQLAKLRLASTAITNDALKLLQVLPGLTHLDLAETATDDQGLQHLTVLPQLQNLSLTGTPVSDRGIDVILKLSSLQRLSLEGSRVSAQGASYLRHTKPKLTVDLVFPFVWGERWSYYDLAKQSEKSAKPQAGSTAFLQQLKHLTSLRYLHVDEALLTPDVLRSLKDLPTLEHLSFHDTTITDDMLADLIGLSQVARLDFSDTRITDRGLAHLKDMYGLRELSLQGTQVTGAGFVHLANLARLQALNLRRTPLDDKGVAHLAGLEELRKLELSSTGLTDAAIEHLAHLPRLQYLDVYGTAVTDRGLARLSRLAALRYLYLSNTKITDAGIEQLRELTELEELGLDGTQLTDQGFARLSPLNNLRRLRIGRTQVTEAGLAQLAHMPNLDRLDLANLPVTDAGLQMLQGMSRLKALDLSGTNIDDDALTALAKLPSLIELNIRDTDVTPEAIARFQQAYPRINIVTGKTPTGYSDWEMAIAILYVIAVCSICFYGLHRYWLTWRLLRDRQVRMSPDPAGQFAELPRVTVQLPMFNERHVAERIIEACCALDYPRDRIQIQVLDDSTDDSADVARLCCERLAAAGHPVEYLHRSNREGFKSGALAAGLRTASGEFIVVFDADFLPDADFLRQTIHYFTDPKVGVIQTEWAHMNRSESWLTELQAMFLDGHFIVEQAVRSRCGRWFNFNGTAGAWRRSCIDEAGGWQHDTLTEDTDLSYRAQLKGWRFLYLPTVHCNGELPSTMTAFVGQQHRWTKGLIQSAKKLLPRIIFSRAPLKNKLEAWYHLTSPIMYLVMFLVTGIAFPAMFLATPFTDQADLALGVGLGTLLLGTFGAATFYVVSQRVQGYSLVGTLFKIPLLMALGIGICAVNARAVMEALLGFRSPFVRTPKFGARGDCDPDQTPTRRRLRFPGGLIELLMAGVLFACLVLSFLRPFTLIGAPFLLLFALGYSGVGLSRLLDQFAARPRQVRTTAAPWFWPFVSRLAVGTVGIVLLAGIAATALAFTSPSLFIQGPREPVALGIDLTTAHWQTVQPNQSAGKSTAIKRVHVERGSLVLEIQLNEQANEGEIILDLPGAMLALGDSLGGGRMLAFNVEYSSRFTGELQAFVRDRQGRLEYGSMQIIESHDVPRPVTVELIPGPRVPAMGYQDKGFDPGAGIRQVGLKISAQSDRVSGAGYRPFRGTIRIASVRITDVDKTAHPDPEIRPLERESKPLPILGTSEFLAGSGVDRPWPIGYAFSGPVTAAHKEELERTYAALERQGCRFTRVYIGDYRTGVVFDRNGKVSGVEPEFLDYLDQLAAIANRHRVTVMFSLTDNAMVNGRRSEGIALLRDGEASDSFVNNVLAEFVKKLKRRQVIWDIFNEPENVTTVPLREIQRYVDRVLAAGRKADPDARFTVVSRSRPEIDYWQGRGLNVYSHNIFTERSLQESLAEPRVLDAPIMVAEMAPELASAKNVDALREAGYAGIGIWGWGTRDKYEWAEADLERIVRPLIKK
jgi:cellulose synthase/poly-beta-1,6-N-acetylglucosamine synthase-like glycosyltransferase/Leucine-rich repeat (LRR) protein